MSRMFPREENENLFLITQLNAISAVFNFKEIRKVLSYTSSNWFGKLILNGFFVLTDGRLNASIAYIFFHLLY